MEDRTDMLEAIASDIEKYYPSVAHFYPEYRVTLEECSEDAPDLFQEAYEETLYGSSNELKPAIYRIFDPSGF